METVCLRSYRKPVTTRTTRFTVITQTKDTRQSGKHIPDIDAENPGSASAKEGQLVSIA